MKISQIIFEMRPSFNKGFTELSCSLKYNGKVVHWREIYEDTDCESRIEGLFNCMKRTIIEKIKEKEKK